MVALTINIFILWPSLGTKKVKEAGIGAATEAATGSATAAFFHRHYSKILDAPKPTTSGGPVTKKIFRLAQLEHLS